MKKLSKLIIVGLLIVLSGCQEESQNGLAEKLNTNQDNLNTVPIESSFNFFKTLKNKVTGKQIVGSSIGLDINLETLVQVDLTNTDAQLNVADATTIFKNIKTEVMQIEIDGEPQTVLFHYVPENNIDPNSNIAEIVTKDFTGSVYSTDLDGFVLSGFKVDGGTIMGAYDFTPPPYAIGDPIPLKDVVVINSYKKPILINDARSRMDYQVVRSQNNCSSIGAAYAAYFKYLKIKAFDDKIKDDLLKPCLKKILDNLKKNGASPGNVVDRFSGYGYTAPNWEIQSGTLNGGTGETSSVYSAFTVTTTFDSQGFPEATDLSWARTILHEAIHAYLVTYFNINKPGWIATYPEMVNDWGKIQNWEGVHHEETARSLVYCIGDALEIYGVSQGYNLTKEFYQDMAWAGLQGTDVFKALPASDQQRILDTIAVELTGMDTNGDDKTQKGKKAGC